MKEILLLVVWLLVEFNTGIYPLLDHPSTPSLRTFSKAVQFLLAENTTALGPASSLSVLRQQHAIQGGKGWSSRRWWQCTPRCCLCSLCCGYTCS